MEEAGKEEARQPAQSELRLAATFTGGVSLAVWMGGIAREMNLLAAAGWSDQRTDTVRGRQVEKYQRLLELLRLNVSIDVLSGTSAGGINAAFLGMANARRLDLGRLRDLWLDEGSLGKLLRDPSVRNPPSLLLGDEVLLNGLRSALETLASGDPVVKPEEGDPTHVFITTTLLSGLESTFKDDYGTAVRDTTHQGLYTFTADQLKYDTALPALALAARSSASFPGAFEPAYVPIGASGDAKHPDMAGFMTQGVRTQFCADGGLLANRPLGPALRAIFDRRADKEVRRVLAYVVPSAGVGDPPTAPAEPRQQDLPGLGAALLADVNALRSQTITAELRALADHNERARGRRSLESRLALLAGEGGDLAWDGLYAEYRAVRARTLAHDAADETLRGLIADGRRSESDGRPVGFGGDLEILTAAAAETLTAMMPDSLGGSASASASADVFEQLAAFGRLPLDGAKATVVRLLRAGFARWVPDARSALNALLDAAHSAVPRRAEESPWTGLEAGLPGTGPLPPGAIAELAASDAWRDAVRGRLTAEATGDLGAGWRELADVVLEARPLLSDLLSGGDRTSADARSVLEYLTGTTTGTTTAAGPDAASVARRLFELQAAQQVMFPDEPAALQAVELVQMSADTRTDLDARSLAGEKLTGLQLNHFGAFYKRSWRANDWMWGRLDGAGWLVHVMLSPRHLKRLVVEDRRGPGDIRAALEKIAGSAPPPGVFDPIPGKASRPELAFLGDPDPDAPDLPTSLPITSQWVASGLQSLIAAEELPCVAEQAEHDRRDGHADTAAGFLAAYRTATQGRTGQAPVPPEGVRALLGACRVSQETFAGERGSKALTRTIVQSAAVAANAVEAGTSRLRSFRPVFGTIGRSLRLAHRVVRSTSFGSRPWLAGLLLVVTGVVALTSTIDPIRFLGAAAVAGGLVVLAIATRALTIVLSALAILAVIGLVLAAAIPGLNEHVFPWLGDTAVPYLGVHPWLWAALVLFVLLPPLWMAGDLLRTVRRR
ncbi:patatin-like protein [Streptomyces triculaminicus]|uniref:patatin-like protein n=1 Tax=Streptomyces triculaminicus TaxID=2816232 RepID=UPI0027DCAB9A|nr:patatin-like protein [Streptomyces triculaminicus]